MALLVLALTAIVGCSEGNNANDGTDGTDSTTGGECVNDSCEDSGSDDGECTPEAGLQCLDGDVYWFDSCGVPGELVSDCDPETQDCVDMGDTEASCVSKTGMCGNGNVESGEDCDGGNLNGQTCQSLGYTGGDLACNPDTCQYDESDCTSCECSEGACCSNGCDHDDSNVVCDPQAETEYGCPSGTEPDADVSVHSRAQFCSGTADSCGDGPLDDWGPWEVHDDCMWNEYCSPDAPTCNTCAFTYNVTQYECQQFSVANGQGPGGGEIIEVCAATDVQSGYTTVKARKYDGTNFGNRPYQVRVSSTDDDPCGPDTWFFTISDSDPVGIGSTELTFEFQPPWQAEQWEKAYCVTASTKVGDPGYDGNNPQQQSWWYSDKAVLTRSCN